MQKALIIFLLSLAGLGYTYAQKITTDQVPGPVAATFRVKFPESQQQTWAKVADGVYQVVFFNGKKRQAARFHEAGNWLETETEISSNQLPGKVNNTIYKEFEGFTIQEAYQIESATAGTLYEVTILKGRENYSVKLSPQGKLLSKVAGDTE